MMLTRYQFELLTYLEKNGIVEYTMRNLVDMLNISGAVIQKTIKELSVLNFIEINNNKFFITSCGLNVLEQYRVKRAVIMAAGFGSRMMPATADRPKPLVTVNGVRIIDTLLDALLAVGIKDITIIRGYKKERFDELTTKYESIKFIDNDLFNSENNISSVMKALPLIDNCYLCEADLFITNPNIILKYQYTSNILGSYSLETDDWSFQLDPSGHIINYQKGNMYCYNYYGISYWTASDSAKLRADWAEIYQSNKDVFWEEVPLILKRENYQVEIRQCNKQDIMEIDNYYELAQLDESYSQK